MKLATSTADFFTHTTSQITSLRHIAKAGFKYADYNFCRDYSLCNGVFSANYDSYVQSVLECANELGIKLIQAHAPMGLPLEDESLIDATVKCVDACSKWNIPNIVVHSGYSPNLNKAQTFERNKKFFMPIIARAERYGINVLVENFNKMYVENLYWIDNAPDLLEMIEYVNHPLFHAVWDVGHANMQDLSQDKALRMLNKHVYALHIHDNMGDEDLHLTPFLGTTDMDAVLSGLIDIGYNGYFTFEVGDVFVPRANRKQSSKNPRLDYPPMQVKDAYERYLYELGKSILTKYDCFTE